MYSISIVVQYFHIEKGIQNKLLDFFENPNETLLKLFKNIEKFIERFNLDPELLSGFVTDNA